MSSREKIIGPYLHHSQFVMWRVVVKVVKFYVLLTFLIIYYFFFDKVIIWGSFVGFGGVRYNIVAIGFFLDIYEIGWNFFCLILLPWPFWIFLKKKRWKLAFKFFEIETSMILPSMSHRLTLNIPKESVRWVNNNNKKSFKV